ncbi:hypothetical protein MASR2M32_27900 [Sphaerotilus sulfidivorans]
MSFQLTGLTAAAGRLARPSISAALAAATAFMAGKRVMLSLLVVGPGQSRKRGSFFPGSGSRCDREIFPRVLAAGGM